jgi:LmbE family N-acetylglucosaminyl deacetylase
MIISATQQLWSFLALILTSILWPQTISTFGKAPAGHEERGLLLIAHPDDETFFFSPTLTALSREIFVVSLSTGNAKGVGDVRKREFGEALDIFGIPAERRFILDHP